MEILIIAFLILLNGIFSMSEVALIASRRFTLESAAKRGNKNARKALELAGKPNTFLSTVQIGITLIGILTGIFSGEKLTKDLELFFDRIPFISLYSESLSVLFVVLILTYFSIVFGELLPKRIGLNSPEKIASMVARPMNFISRLTRPFIWLLVNSNELLLKLLNIREKQDGIISEEEIQSIIAASTRSGEIQEIEKEIVQRVFALGDRKAAELMTHRSDLTWININDNLDSIHTKIELNSHSSYPVSGHSADELLGLVSVNQIFQKSFNAADFSLKDLILKPVYVQENMAAYRVLEKFREFKVHLVVVVDEHGSMQGVLSIRDLVSALIGDTFNQKNGDSNIVQRGENSWLAEGQCPYYEFVSYFHITDTLEAEGFTTLAGLILSQLNNFPVIGDRMKWGNFEFEIIDMDEMRIDKIMITKLPA